MKKLRFLSICLIGVMLGGCATEGEVTPPEEETPQVNVKTIDINSSPKDVSQWEPLGKFEVDVTGDDEEDVITLYTSARRDKSGDIMWDDTQEWILQVETANGTYKLYDERIHGYVYLNVADYYNGDNDEKVISLYVGANAFNEVREYRFSDNAFSEIVAYSTDNAADGGINTFYSSVPVYE